jgi:hypothetical protein
MLPYSLSWEKAMETGSLNTKKLFLPQPYLHQPIFIFLLQTIPEKHLLLILSGSGLLVKTPTTVE